MHDADTSLVQPAELARRLADDDCLVVDCRFNLARPDAGEAAYLTAHIPGAFYAHLDRDLSAPRTAGSGRHPLPDSGEFAKLLSTWGVTADTRVTAYDDVGGAIAARLWWLLRWMGHRRVSLLDGGLPAWLAAGLPLTAELPRPRTATFVGQPGQMPSVEAREIEQRLPRAELLLLDARARPRFLGQEEPIDPVAGHVPGAVNAPHQENLAAGGSFRPPEELRGRFTALLAGRDVRDVAVMCGSGVTACQVLFALELAGLPGARLYPGSWSEWIRPGTRPVERS
jgi:thiosulfate/3-mercaptopyruvate sulfurtransferase